ncbi:MAG: hypothetical protein Q8K58_11550 [Acidimicrobiales bacterium]|nr:hypothetical protein [Acidimicrobiales bacterium]
MERFWTLAEHRHVYVDLRPEQAGHAMLTLLVDHDAFLAVGHRTGIEPESEET